MRDLDTGDVQHFHAANLPAEGWCEYRTKVSTRMVRIDGPFVVETREGPLTCPDGYLALDSRGWPYPIAADEQALVYGEASVGIDAPVAAATAVLVCVAALFGAGLGIALAYTVGFATAIVVALVLMVAATLLVVGAIARWGRSA